MGSAGPGCGLSAFWTTGIFTSIILVGVLSKWIACPGNFVSFHLERCRIANAVRRSRLRSEPRHPLNTDEAVRLICMTLVVTSVQYPDDTDAVPSTSLHADVPPSPPASTSAASGKMPIVTFTGTARALHSAWDPNANSAIRGTVSTTPEGEIRWTSVSVYHGDEERWKSEGIQVGGARSARGVMGSWFDKDYDPAGPAGPTAFWKIRDTVNCENRNTGGWGDGESDDEL